MPSVLITGGAGFIPSYMSRHFVQQGFDVTIADHFDMQGKGKNIADILTQVHLLIGDLAYGDLADRCAQSEPDYIVHAAAFTHVDDAILYPERFVTNNMIGTTRLLQSLWERYTETAYQPEKILVVSTDEVYGPTPPGVRFTEDAPYHATNAYSASKVGVEAITGCFWHTHKLPLVIVRPCNTYAPGQFPSKVIPKFVRQMLLQQDVTLYNDGQGSRDWLHATDHARAIEILLEHGVPGEAYNLGAGEEHTDADICREIEMILSRAGFLGMKRAHVVHVPGRPGHDRRYAMNWDKLHALGWAPQVPFAMGLEATVLWNAHHMDWWDSDRVRMQEPPCQVASST